MRKLISFLFLVTLYSSAVQAGTGTQEKKHYDFWPRIPFNLVGANLCEFRAAYSQTRSEYMAEMTDLAEGLLMFGDADPANTLARFNSLYDRNLIYARRGLGVTLEGTFKAYLDQYYRKLKPRVRKLSFRSMDDQSVDIMAYGSYSMSPNCRGNVVATLTPVHRDGYTKEYMGQGRAQTVMSQIASKVFEDFQRTKFPSNIKIGNRTVTLLGGLNGQVDSVFDLQSAKHACRTLGARLPNASEYAIINSYGSWSGGVSLGKKVWALNSSSSDVYTPEFNSMRVRHQSQVNDHEFYYICIR